MSDTSGANLEGDMPGLGTAPPQTGVARSPLQLPSALQGLAGLFNQQRQPQGPRFQPPKPPPLTEEQARKPPQHTGNPASLAPAPPTVPVPTGGFSPYIKTPNKRDISEWGNPVQFPRLPQTFELPPMFAEIGRHFSQSGGEVGDAASALAGHSQAYIDAYMKAQDWKMRMAANGQKLAADRLDTALTNRQIDYRDTISEYLNAAGGDATKLATTEVGGVDLYHALAQEAYADGDTQAQAMFEAGRPLEEIINYMHDADKNLRDLQAARKKASDQEVDDGLFGLKPGEGSDDPLAVFKRPADKVVDPAAKPDPANGELDPQVPKPLREEGLNIAKGFAPSKGLNKQEDRVATRFALDLQDGLDKIADDASHGRIKPEDVVPAVRKLSPAAANELQDWLDYKKGMGGQSGSGQGGKEQDWYNRMATLASAARPPKNGLGGWNAGNYATIQQFKAPGGRPALQLGRAGPAGAAAQQVLEDLDNIQRHAAERGETLGADSLTLESIKGKMGVDADYNALWADWQNYNQDINALTVPGGSVTEERISEEQVPWFGTAADYRNVVKRHMGVAEKRIDEFQHQWDSLGSPDPMPWLAPGDRDQIDNIRRMNPRSGTLPGGHVWVMNKRTGKRDEFIYTGKNAANPEADENYEPVNGK